MWSEGLLNIFFNSDNFFSLLPILTKLSTSLSDSAWTLKLGRPAALKVNFSLYFTRFLSFNISANLLRIRLLSSGKGLKNLLPSEANTPYSKSVCTLSPFGLKSMKIVSPSCTVLLTYLYRKAPPLIHHVPAILGRCVNKFKPWKVEKHAKSQISATDPKNEASYYMCTVKLLTSAFHDLKKRC